MLVGFGDPMTSREKRETAWLDTTLEYYQQPEGLGWFYHQVFLHPGLLKQGVFHSDGLKIYQVLEVQGPLFEEGGVYCLENKAEPAVLIKKRVGFVGLFLYFFEWKGRLYLKTEASLLKFLTAK